MKKVFGLVDCNNFFVSCERLFDPSSKKVPAVVFSNNDGCIIARSNEAKKIGIKMGEPVFKCKELIEFFNVKGYSTNFSLYKDISSRVMTVLSYYACDMQVYSVDEAFLDLTNHSTKDFWKLAKEIRESVIQYVGIPVSIGISTSKTLAKVASKLAKKKDGSFVLMDRSENEQYLKNFEINDVWGIGWATTKKLYKIGVETPYDYINLDSKYVLNHFGVNGLRTWWELKGESVIKLHDVLEIPKSMAHTRTFRAAISDYEDLKKQISHFASSLSFQLREQKLFCSQIFVFVRENRFKGDFYGNNHLVKIEQPTNLAIDITKYAVMGLNKIFKSGKKYKKAGVIALKISKANENNLMFQTNKDKQEKAQYGVDKLNTHWENIVVLGSEYSFKNRYSDYKTPEYTTNYTEIKTVF